MGAAGENPRGAKIAMNAAAVPLFRMDGISKRYGGVRALEEARLECASGRIHAVLGENGAGKSTLIKVMAGVVRPDAGIMELEGPAGHLPQSGSCHWTRVSPAFSRNCRCIPDLSVADNIAITSPPTRFGLIDRRSQRRLAEEALARAGAGGIHPLSRVKDLPLSRRQMVEIAKALARSPKILVLDEATSALTAADVERVFRVLKQLRSEGLAIVYISHRMHEIAELADDCTVFRNGRYVATFKAGTKSDDAIVEMMIGREYKSVFPPKPTQPADRPPTLIVRNLGWAGRLKESIFLSDRAKWSDSADSTARVNTNCCWLYSASWSEFPEKSRWAGSPLRLKAHVQPRADNIGMAFIPEDRKTEGLMLPMSVRDNLSFAAIERFSRFGLIDTQESRRRPSTR